MTHSSSLALASHQHCHLVMSLNKAIILQVMIQNYHRSILQVSCVNWILFKFKSKSSPFLCSPGLNLYAYLYLYLYFCPYFHLISILCFPGLYFFCTSCNCICICISILLYLKSPSAHLCSKCTPFLCFSRTGRCHHFQAGRRRCFTNAPFLFTTFYLLFKH